MLARSAATGGGALVGGVLAIPIAGFLFTFLFEQVGEGIMESIISDGLEDASGAEAIIGAIFLPIMGILVAVTIVAALVAPVFLVLPMGAVAVALRLTRAGLIMRTVGVTLIVVLALTAVVLMVANAAGLELEGWVLFPVLGIGGFLSRYLVETRWPDRAGVSERVVLGPRWTRLALAWVVLLLIGAAVAVAVALTGVQVSSSG